MLYIIEKKQPHTQNNSGPFQLQNRMHSKLMAYSKLV